MVQGRFDHIIGNKQAPKRPLRVPEKYTKYDEDFAKITDFESQLQSLRLRGFQRAYRPYEPPHDMEQKFMTACDKCLKGGLPQGANLAEIKIEGVEKAALLSEIADAMGGHRVPNSMLHTMTTLDKVFSFYSTPVDMMTPYERIEAGVRFGDMPQNLHVQLEPHRFDPEGGSSRLDRVTAFPRSSTILSTPEAKKRWKEVKAKKSPWQYTRNDEAEEAD